MLNENDDRLLKNFKWTTDPQDIGEILNALSRVPVYSFDLETTSLDWVRGSIHGIALATEHQEWYLSGAAVPAIMPGLQEIIADTSKTLVGHNLKFDFHFMDRFDTKYGVFFDTMIAQFLIDENQKLGLKDVAYMELGLEDELPDFKDLLKSTQKAMKIKKAADISIYDIPQDVLARYAGRDARINFDIFGPTLKKLSREGFEDLYFDKEAPFLLVLKDMEAAGMYIDQQNMNEVRRELVEAQEEALDIWNKATDNANPNSPDQVAHWLYTEWNHEVTRWTRTNKPSVDKLALMRIQREANNPAIKALQDYKMISKLIGTYIDSWQEKLFNGRIYGSYNQIGAKTTRLSSSDPNLQNIPSHGTLGSKLKYMIAGEGDNMILVSDYSQVELRLLAHYSQDPLMMKIYEEDGDIHQDAADRLGVERFQAKEINFGWVYGLGWRGLQDSLEEKGKPRPDARDAKRWIYAYDNTYSGAANWKSRALDYATKLGYITTIWGKKRRLPNLNSFNEDERARAGRQAINAIIQGSAANIIEDAMLSLAPKAKALGGMLIGQVHDEVVFEMPADVVEAFGHAVKEDMESVRETYNIRVPIKADYDIAKTWGGAKG